MTRSLLDLPYHALLDIFEYLTYPATRCLAATHSTLRDVLSQVAEKPPNRNRILSGEFDTPFLTSQAQVFICFSCRHMRSLARLGEDTGVPYKLRCNFCEDWEVIRQREEFTIEDCYLQDTVSSTGVACPHLAGDCYIAKFFDYLVRGSKKSQRELTALFDEYQVQVPFWRTLTLDQYYYDEE